MSPPIKNEKNTYRTRSIIGGANIVDVPAERPERMRQVFEVDSAGYFVWEKSAKKPEAELTFL